MMNDVLGDSSSYLLCQVFLSFYRKCWQETYKQKKKSLILSEYWKCFIMTSQYTFHMPLHSSDILMTFGLFLLVG